MEKDRPSANDFIIFNNRIAEIIAIDADGDFWVASNTFNIKDNYVFKGRSLIDVQSQNMRLFNLIPHGTFKKDKEYVLLRIYNRKISKIKLTKLTKKLYNLPQEFCKSLYSMEEI